MRWGERGETRGKSGREGDLMHRQRKRTNKKQKDNMSEWGRERGNATKVGEVEKDAGEGCSQAGEFI